MAAITWRNHGHQWQRQRSAGKMKRNKRIIVIIGNNQISAASKRSKAWHRRQAASVSRVYIRRSKTTLPGGGVAHFVLYSAVVRRVAGGNNGKISKHRKISMA